MEFKNQFECMAVSRFSKTFAALSKQEKYTCVAMVVQQLAASKYKETTTKIELQQAKEVYYFSMEFLMGRLLINNIENMGIYEDINAVLMEYGISIKDVEFEELDAGLGNGGLGRLAACFLDSIASLNYPGHGITIRYRNGFFKQAFKNNEQVELPDLWLQNGNVWENQMYDDACVVSFYGDWVFSQEENQTSKKLINTMDVLAMPYDMPIVGKGFHTCNSLRMYDVCPIENQFKKENYEEEVFEIAKCLYPDDSTTKGKKVRLKQQYVFVSAGLQNILKKHMRVYGTLEHLDSYVVLQINDTHPVLLIPEMMRILMDIYHYDYDTAWSLTTKCIAYTNHTILAEALEQWDVSLMKELLPRVYDIIMEIDRQFIGKLTALQYDTKKIEHMQIIHNKRVRMANMALICCFSVNGVAALHTQILKDIVFYDWNLLFPNKINNKTNGITQRRWFEYSNAPLFQGLLEFETQKDKSNPVAWFEQFLQYHKQNDFLCMLERAKHQNKRELISYVAEKEGIHLPEHSIFDIQIKRLHAYKRQLLNVLHIIYLYQRLKTDVSFYNSFHPQTFIFGAKAASSYVFAKNVIKLIKVLQEKVNIDPQVNEKLMVVMVTNYNVSYAEKLIPAADISEQISTAGFEASGTGNMKFMMNGAITLGTLDGANVEIEELVGPDNIEIFGLKKDEVFALHKEKTYQAKDAIKNDPYLKQVMELLNEWNVHKQFQPILDNLLKENDYYFVLKDFDAYRRAQEKLNALYQDKNSWYEQAAVNIAKSGFFSSDRTIQNYVDEIWKLNTLK